MNRHSATAIALSSVVAAVVAVSCATRPPVPDTLQPPATEMLALETTATGVQVYECSGVQGQPDRYEWAFKAPEAELFDKTGRRIGRHYAGPTWEADDGSTVVGAVKARVDSPTAGAIPWLLLTARSTAGSGVFGRTTSIQRLATQGGSAPGGACGPAQAGEVARVGYRATYHFYVARS